MMGQRIEQCKNVRNKSVVFMLPEKEKPLLLNDN